MARLMAAGAACLFMTGTVLAQDPAQEGRSPDLPTIPGLVPQLSPPTPGLESILNQNPEEAADAAFPLDSEIKKVNDSVAGWNSAEGGRAFNIGETLRRSWVMLDSEGKLRGQIMGTEFDHTKTEVYFVREGIMIEELTANAKGEFLAYGLEEGVYTVLVANDGRYAVNCLLVLENNQMGGPPSSFNVPMSDPSPRTVFEQVVSRATKVSFRNFGEFAFEEGTEDPARLFGLKGIREHRPSAIDATTLGNNQVQLTDDGQLIGRLRAVDHLNGRPVDLTVTEVMLIANDEKVDSTQTNRFGVFTFSGIKPGYYTLFASGKDGIVVTSFELMDAPAPAPVTDVAPVSFRSKQAVNYLDVTLSPRRDVGWVNSYFRDHVPPPRIPPVEDVPYNPYASYGDYGYPYGMDAGLPWDMCGCGLCGEVAWWGTSCFGCRKGWFARLKAKCGLHHGCDSGCTNECCSGH
jgi:hypothetical protein